jgi:hypothetical protein
MKNLLEVNRKRETLQIKIEIPVKKDGAEEKS